MAETDHSKLDAWLDLLADQVAERLSARAARETKPEPPRPVLTAVQPPPPQPPPVRPTAAAESVAPIAPTPLAPAASHAAALMARLALGVLLVVILVNIPLNAQGTALARSIPSSASLVLANGLVVKEENSPDIWVYRDEQFHWITSLDAFNHYGYRWQDVHIVEPGFLSQFEKGNPIYVLLKCDASPHIYRLDGAQRRWIVDLATFEAEGYVWQDVKMVPCSYLRQVPDGESIPPGRGTPPPPLP